ncbi:hypothetical protein EG329_007537 [Mollisiaceae sp. DMI_Dod_QoI]|nr:hypothetical protein EG329_007537 [Helotiales sp. DMI_Dod_QoI]
MSDQPKPNSRPKGSMEQNRFSLAPAIFLPFSGFPQMQSTAPALEPAEKLQKIIENLGVQQERVRGNMMFLVEQQAERLAAKAREELSDFGSDSEDGEREQREKRNRQKSVDALFASTRVSAKKGARSEDFEFKVEKVPSNALPAKPGGPVGGDGDVTMGGTEILTTPRSPPGEDDDIDMDNIRSPREVLTSLSSDLKDLVNRGAPQMQAYDIHAKTVVQHYKQALDRRASRTGSMASPINTAYGGTGGGILRKGSDASPVDTHGIRRMSSGMPITGFSMGQQPVRVPETIEELARRGSK